MAVISIPAFSISLVSEWISIVLDTAIFSTSGDNCILSCVGDLMIYMEIRWWNRKFAGMIIKLKKKSKIKSW
jgi:hypothetical protein